MFFFYVGRSNYAEAAAYIKKKLAAEDGDADLEGWPLDRIYVDFVCDTNAENPTRVFTTVEDAVIQDAMKFSGMI